MSFPHPTEVPGDRERRRRDVETALEWTAAHAAETGCFFDFDGTLSRIVPDPAVARLVPGAAEALTALTHLVGRVAVVSARPVEFLATQIPAISEISLFGLYGAESRIGNGPVTTHPAAAAAEPVMVDLANRAKAELPAGVYVEFKRLSVALHYRAVPHHRAAVEAWASAMAVQLGLGAQAGRMVVEVKPPGERGKGAAVAEQLAGLRGGWFFGDDLSDLQAFAALDAAEQRDDSFVGVRVAVANPENGDAVQAAADVCLGGPEEVPGFLTRMIQALTTGD